MVNIEITKGDLLNLCDKLIREHYKDMEERVKDFKWLAAVPQSGDGFERHKNVWELQDTAVKRMDAEKEGLILLLREICL